ncbi:unnamed protein product, partial [marine sediment metagenome]
CNQCFYNRPKAFYLPIGQRHFPTLEEVGDGIVRVNSGHDSNIDRHYVIRTTEQYPKRFFNTSIPRFNFPAPVVFTANPNEEEKPILPHDFVYHETSEYEFDDVMFVRLRVSSTNLHYIIMAAEQWGIEHVPVVLTFMRYYVKDVFAKQNDNFYNYRKYIINPSWCPTEEFMRLTLQIVSQFNPRIEMCGTPTSSFCKDCLNCEKYYRITKRRMNESTTSQ